MVFLTSNPLYLSLALLVSCGVYQQARESAKGRALTPFVGLGVSLAVLTLPLNVLTGSVGGTTLAELPQVTLPRWFGNVAVGGTVTAEALVVATGRALGIATLVLLAASFNAAVDHFRLLRLAPRSLSQLMLSLTVAVLVVPQAVARGRAVAEAKRLRGRPARGLRALPGLLLPVLYGALERAVQRAESMDARGLAGGGPRSSGPLVMIGVLGLGLAAWGGFWHYYDGPGPLPAATAALGVLVVAGVLLRGGVSGARRLRDDPWSARDVVAAGAAALALAIVAGLRLAGAADLEYVPYPEVTAPGFDVAAAGAFLLLLAPAVASAPDEADR